MRGLLGHRRRARMLALLTSMIGAALVVALLLRARDRELALEAYLLLVGAVAVLALLRVMDKPSADGSRAAELGSRAERVASVQPAELVRLERDVSVSGSSASEFHRRLRPLLREVAATRLLSQHGLGIDTDPEAAARVLGPDLWEIVRPERPLPRDVSQRGPSLRELERHLETIEAI